MGSAQVDSRTTVPNAVSCSHSSEVSSITGDAASQWSAHLFRLARGRVPFRRVGFLELRAGNERLVQIFRIIDDTGHHQPNISVGLLETVEVLLHRGARSVGNAILAQ